MDRQQSAQHRRGRQVLELDVDADFAKTIALTLVEGEGEDEAVALRGQFGHRGEHAKIGISFGQIEFAQKFAIIGHPVGVVTVVGRQKPVPAALLGRDHAAQLALAEILVADEIYAANAGELAFVDLEDEIDPIFRELDDLGFHRRAEPAMPAVKIEDALDVALHPGARIDNARAQLDLGIELLVVELVVSLKGDAVDDRVLDDLDDERVADPAQPDIGKQSGREQRFQRRIHLLVVPRVARLELEIRADGFGFDPLRPDDPNVADSAPTHGRDRRSRYSAGERRGARACGRRTATRLRRRAARPIS